MTEQGKPEGIIADPEKSIIIVSDLHLGAHRGGKTSENFSSFLEWLNTSCDESKEIQIEIKHRSFKKLKPPQMLILLGDIIDLWVQREPLRKALAEDTFSLISKLLDLPIPIVYVIGNHDREIYEIKGKFPEGNESSKKIIIEPDQFPFPKTPNQIINRQGLKLGKKYEYTFLHGHQLDPSFKVFRSFSEYPGWVSNNSSIFELHPWARRISWFCVFFGILYAVLLLLNVVSFIPSIIHNFILVIVGISIPFFIISIPSEWLNTGYSNLSHNPIGKRIKSFIKKRSNAERWKRIDYFRAVREFIKKRDEGGTNVVVFGHTHMMDDYNDIESNKRFINSGTWDNDIPYDADLETGVRYHIVGKDKDSNIDTEYFSRKFVCNTFIYLDNEGPLTMIWDTDNAKDPAARYLEIKQITKRDVE